MLPSARELMGPMTRFDVLHQGSFLCGSDKVRHVRQAANRWPRLFKKDYLLTHRHSSPAIHNFAFLLRDLQRNGLTLSVYRLDHLSTLSCSVIPTYNSERETFF